MRLIRLHPLAIIRVVSCLAAALAALTAFQGCAAGRWKGFPTEVNPELAWPGPPETARVAYVTSIRSHQDLFRLRGLLGGIVRLVAGPPDTRMVRPYALALHPRGGLLVTDPGRRGVHFYDWTHRKYVLLGDDLDGGLPSPVGVGVLPEGDILVSDSRLERVERFRPSGKTAGTFAGGGVLGRPAGIAVDSQRGEVFIADVTGHRIAVFDLEGAPLRTFGERGDSPGQFNFPTHLALAPQGCLAVADSMNFRVQVLQPDGTLVTRVGRLGNAPGQFAKPKGVATDGEGNIIAVEGLYDSVEFFDSQGRLLLNIGGPGSEPGRFWLPAGLVFDPSRNLLFVADSYNSRVQVFRLLPPQAAPGLLPSTPEPGEKGRMETQ